MTHHTAPSSQHTSAKEATVPMRAAAQPRRVALVQQGVFNGEAFKL